MVTVERSLFIVNLVFYRIPAWILLCARRGQELRGLPRQKVGEECGAAL